MALKFKVPSVPKIKNPISTLKNTASNVGKTVNKIASNPVVKTVTAPNRAVINADAAIAKGAVGVAKDVGLLKSKTTPTTLGASPISGTGLGAIGVSTGSGAKTTYTPPPVRTGAKTTATSKTQEQAQQEGIAQGLTGANLQRYVESSVFGTPSTQQGNTQATFSINDLRTPSDVPTNTGSLNATLNNPSASNISDLQKQYLALMQPNADEQNLADRLAALDESTNLGISGMEGQGRGIPREVIQGKQRLLAEQAGIEKQSLIDRLANATAQRQASAQALGAQLNFETQRQQQEQSQMQPFMFGQDLVRYNPSTGQIETVAQGVQQAASPLTLSPGETLYDPNTGQAIYTAPSSGASNGFSLSPGQTRYDQFGNVIASAPGGTGAAGSYTAQQAKDIGFYNRASSAEQNVQAALEGGVGGLLIQSALPNFAQSKDYQQYRQAAETWIKAVLRQESGAAIPPEEMNSYMKTYFPQPGDRQETVAQKQQARQDAMNALTVNVPQQGITNQSTNQNINGLYQLLQNGQISQDEFNYLANTGQSFSNVGGDTNKAAIQSVSSSHPVGSSGGQCGRFVNKLTGLGVGDSYQSKMAKTDPSIGTANNPPRSGDVFVMPYKNYGHIGFVESVIPKSDGTYDLVVLDSNWGLDEKVQRHVLSSQQISGYARPAIKV